METPKPRYTRKTITRARWKVIVGYISASMQIQEDAECIDMDLNEGKRLNEEMYNWLEKTFILKPKISNNG